LDDSDNLEQDISAPQHMAHLLVLATIFAASVDGLIVHRTTQTNSSSHVDHGNGSAKAVTFQAYYNHHTDGRGIWKWNNALDAYQRHFGPLAGGALSVAEVGVQSGGSMLMWKAALGNQIKLYGLDINPACKSFEEPASPTTGGGTVITIGDQADWKMWEGFFATTGAELDIIVDDGGHEPIQMLTTLQASFAHLKPGGYAFIEDIAGTWYLDPMFKPAATFISQMAPINLIASVHLYPLVLLVRKGGFAAGSPQEAQGALAFAGSRTDVTDFTTMWTAISTVPPGSHIVLKNPQWTNLFLVDSLTNFFINFNDLQQATFKDTPTGCAKTANPVCTNEITPLTHLQSRVSGVHIYKDHAVIEVPAVAPRISATRRGNIWISYR